MTSTLRDELVKLFREHRLNVPAAKCDCGVQFDRRLGFKEVTDVHRSHLAALACERVGIVGTCDRHDHCGKCGICLPTFFGLHQCAALGKVKRG